MCSRCDGPVAGQAQVCDGCREKAKLCQKCGQPHGGPPATTRLCPICRAATKGRRRGPSNPAWTEAEDAQLRDAYERFNCKEIGAYLAKLFPTRPRWSWKRRATQIGAATVRRKEPPWSTEEDAILVAHAHLVPERIVLKLKKAGFVRTINAVAIRRNRQHLKEHIDGMSAMSLSKLINIDVHAVLKWIKRGWLAAERTGTTGDHHDAWFTTTEQIRAFLLAHPECIELSKLERVGSKMWFLELVSGGAIREGGAQSEARAAAAAPVRADSLAPAERRVPFFGEKVTLAALAVISGRTVGDLEYRIDELGMSVQDAALGKASLPGSGVAAAPEELSPLAASVVEQLRRLMKTHRAKQADLVRWTGQPEAVVAQVLAGALPFVAAELLAVLAPLDGEVTLTIVPRKRAF